MIQGLDHVTLAVRALAPAREAYATLLGRPPVREWRREGRAGALFRLANLGLEVLAPEGEGALGTRLQAHLDAHGEGLASVAFRVDDLERAARRAGNVGLAPQEIVPGGADGERWRTVRLADAACHGVKTFLIERPADPAVEPPVPGGIAGLDHLVIRTPAPERAAAHYGARLGLDMRMDRAAPEWGARMMFFRLGDLILEVVSPAAAAGPDDPPTDALWGLSWRAPDLDAARARLAAAGLDVSEARTGRKPGTRVFTVRTGTAGVPTLVLAYTH